jgi:hypothetical protein
METREGMGAEAATKPSETGTVIILYPALFPRCFHSSPPEP